MVCDLTDYETFTDMDAWLKDFIQNADRNDLTDYAFVLLGNKADLARARLASSQNGAGAETSGTGSHSNVRKGSL